MPYQPTPEVVMFTMILFLITAFVLGYTAAETHERRAHAMTKKSLQEVHRQKRELSNWVRKNWPSETAAYSLGHIEGYQQGVTQSPELEERARLSE